jgi:class 3 adenylate cyclase
VTVGSIDIVGNSALVNKHGIKKMEKMYFRFWNFLRRLLRVYDGRIWSWAGDGGIMAFTFKGHEVRAVQCALEIQALLSVFNLDPDKSIPDDIQTRIGLDSGKIKFFEDTGRIISDTINFAAHLEKQFTPPKGIAVSESVRENMPKKLKELFCTEDTFEEKRVYSICLPELRIE